MFDAATAWNGTPLGVIDIPKLKDFFHVMVAHMKGPIAVADIQPQCLTDSLDQAALFYALMALQSLSESPYNLAATFRRLCSRSVALFTCPPTLDLLTALHIQQHYILKSGTAAECHTALAQAVQVAEMLKQQDLGPLNRMRFLRLYLMLQFSDQ